MGFRLTRYLFVITAAVLAVTISISPVAAYTELRTTGTVGAHSLTDTRSSPGADCLYRFSDVGTAWVLRRINADPPNVRAVPGQGTQQVGWSFTIQRQFVNSFAEEPGPWEHRYTSPVMKATTDSTHDASFSPMGVRVRVPGEPGSDAWYWYRAIVKAIWYRPNGNIMGTARMRVEWFKSFMGDDSAKQRWSCRSQIF